MHISKITCVFFSATGLTDKTMDVFASALPLPAEKINVTPFSAQETSHSFGPEELVVFAAPVYGGRIPKVAAERFANMKGAQTPAVCLAVYGNRAYEDALLEMDDTLRANGFVPVAAAALLAEHSIMHSVAAGRPDTTDDEKIVSFAEDVWRKLADAQDVSQLSPLVLPGSRPYQPYPSIPLKPSASNACVHCGKCAQECPVDAIPSFAPDTTDKEKCISCMRCVTVCPVHARSVNKIALMLAEKVFAFKYGARKEPDFFS